MEREGPLQQRQAAPGRLVLVQEPFLPDPLLVPGQRRRNRPEQALAIDRLEQVIRRPLLHAGHHATNLPRATEHDDFLVGPVLPQLRDEIQAIADRSDPVQQHQVERAVPLDQLRHPRAMGRGLDVVTLVREQSLDQVAEIGLVIDDEYPRLGSQAFSLGYGGKNGQRRH